jgi:hypothetical protein
VAAARRPRCARVAWHVRARLPARVEPRSISIDVERADESRSTNRSTARADEERRSLCRERQNPYRCVRRSLSRNERLRQDRAVLTITHGTSPHDLMSSRTRSSARAPRRPTRRSTRPRQDSRLTFPLPARGGSVRTFTTMMGSRDAYGSSHRPLLGA